MIEGKRQSHRDSLYHAYRQYQRAYRKGDYKLIEYVKAASKRRVSVQQGSRVTQLFNLSEDFWETNNLAYYSDKQTVKLLEQMRTEMKQAARQCGDTVQRSGAEADFWESYD